MNDPTLGRQVHEHLIKAGIETPMSSMIDTTRSQDKRIQVVAAFGVIMKMLGLDTDNDSLKDTPIRVAKMYCDEIFHGLSYDNFPSCTMFKSASDEMIALPGIEVKSMCEHHFLPFVGTATVGYIPNKKIIGISKLNRIVDFFSRRPQVQERLTDQIAQTVSFVLSTDDVAVVIDSVHYCTRMRGVKDFSSHAVTSKLLGRFRSVPELRSEFIGLTRSL